MNQELVQYEYVGIENPHMRRAYEMAKHYYMLKRWNLKTTPVAVLVKADTPVSIGICANGMHAVEGKCGRLKESGLPYDACQWCAEEEHAERKALQAAYDADLNGADIYLYGHYKMCGSCIRALKNRGVKRFILLENSQTLFDRHNPDTVLGTDKQFVL